MMDLTYSLLIFSDFTKSYGSWSEFVGFLDSIESGWGTLARGLRGGEVFARCLGSSTLSGCLLGAGHKRILYFYFLFKRKTNHR